MRSPLKAGALALALLAASCGSGDGDAETATENATEVTEPAAESGDAGSNGADDSGAQAPQLNFSVQTATGDTLNGADLEGDIVFWFWAPW